MRLMREVRWYGGGEHSESHAAVENGWAGTGAARPVLPFLILRTVVDGIVDPATGFLCDIKRIDELIRSHVVPRLRSTEASDSPFELPLLARKLIECFDVIRGFSPPKTTLQYLQLRVSPFTNLTLEQGTPRMIHLTQSYEFSASHRLHCTNLTDEENQKLFGKCSNPHGHGHNYVLDVTIAGDPDPCTGLAISIGELDRCVNEQVIEPFDHKNLNIECPEFQTLNPTVENIASAIHRRLVAALGPNRSVGVRVWETPKTFAEIPVGCLGEESKATPVR